MTNEEYIDAINKAIDGIEKLKQGDLSGGIYSGESSQKGAIRKGCDQSKRFCANCATAYIGPIKCPNCNCGTEAL